MQLSWRRMTGAILVAASLFVATAAQSADLSLRIPLARTLGNNGSWDNGRIETGLRFEVLTFGQRQIGLGPAFEVHTLGFSTVGGNAEMAAFVPLGSSVLGLSLAGGPGLDSGPIALHVAGRGGLQLRLTDRAHDGYAVASSLYVGLRQSLTIPARREWSIGLELGGAVLNLLFDAVMAHLMRWN
jgi:hypothetical protein